MKRLIPLALLALTAPALAQPAPEAAQGRPQRAYANPSALIAADIAIARLAREKGHWAAFRETADEAAELLESGRVLAKTALKDRKDPAKADQWAPRSAWISCDGSAGLTFGGWQNPNGGNGEYISVWQRQIKGKVDWKWVLRDGQALSAPLRDLDWAEGKVADCRVRKPTEGAAAPATGKRKPEKQSKVPPILPLAGPIPPSDAPTGADSKDGQSHDGTLAWRSTVMPDGSRRFAAWMWKDGAMQEVVLRNFKADGA
ncbi:hypothetical protein IP81_16520 [Novosphingobium sp. AAP83]|uniref:hypothetical protein n=1 Tax=Novosphingobium sp. AAP83 TaxID=1523425 RepID=UPI0006B9A250|nr:hypothetical protein [Novosphingobium sp. AAP83]KPF89637.1 hypothetical protein IP81_16520 [Novosphingobium sp. AAP83]